ncbi:unnamed protein product [Darwinula stevensoni]|uniref:G-protein coupled receptors family 1 profile domain-containing protein n=1 Tax=Darwinula stevensoni TaxID=69355 RepID=A0A7R8X5U7_9CRUS|nr:unnamed protein product [Darwinula stevensoni]CAG0887029.1 unnamed protein product [Darwinula stevensoni]
MKIWKIKLEAESSVTMFALVSTINPILIDRFSSAVAEYAALSGVPFDFSHTLGLRGRPLNSLKLLSESVKWNQEFRPEGPWEDHSTFCYKLGDLRKTDTREEPQNDTDLDEKFLSRFDPSEDHIIGSILLCLGVMSLVPNGMVLHSFWETRKQLKPPEVFLLNLTFFDGLTVLLAYPTVITSFFLHRWPFGSIGCNIDASLVYFTSLIGMFSLTAISIMRCIKTCKPQYGDRLTKGLAWKWMWFIWGYAGAWTVMPLLGWGRYDVEPYGLSCTLDWWGSDLCR